MSYQLVSTGVFSVLAAVGFLAAKYPDNGIGTKRRRDVKQPPSYPLLGGMMTIVNDVERFHHVILSQHEALGLTFSDTFPLEPRVYMTADPKNLDHCLHKNFENYIKGPFMCKRLSILLGEGIFSTDGPNWRYQRKTAAHLFNVKNFRDFMMVVFLEDTEKLCGILERSALEGGGTIDLREMFYRFTMDTFGRIGFGVDFNSMEAPVPFAQAFDEVQANISKRFTVPCYQLVESYNKWVHGYDPFTDNVALIHDQVQEIIEQRRADPRNLKGRADLLSLFSTTKNPNGQMPSDKEMKDVVLNFLLAGRDTTAGTLSWAFYLLSKYPNVQEKLFEEVQDITFSASRNKEIFEKVKTLKYAQAIWQEVLRLYPAVPMNSKVAVNDDVLPDGTQVYAGEVVGWNSWAMGRLTALWGEDAKEFRPERWFQPELIRPNPATWPAFHAGPRNCLGQAMATLEGVTCMAWLVNKYQFSFSEGGKVEERAYKMSLTLPMRDPLFVNITKRQ